MRKATILGLLLLVGCGLDLDRVREIQPGSTTKAQLTDWFGKPDMARARGQQTLWIYRDAPPHWPVYIPIWNIFYGIYLSTATKSGARLTVTLDPNGVVASGVYEGREVIRLKPKGD